MKTETLGNEYKAIFSRNIGVMSESDQKKLGESYIAIAGMGGVGGLLAERLIRLGVGRLKITDPGYFEKSNLNRQLYSSTRNLNRNKAEVLYSHLKDINPEADIDWSDAGIKNASDANAFTSGCDLVVDEMDLGLFKESILLQRAARQKGIYYIFTGAMGYGALIAIFDPKGLTLEEYNGLSPLVDVETMDKRSVPLEKVIPIMPSYVTIADREIINKMHTGELPGSAISIGAGMASILAANEATNIILKKRDIATAPRYTYIDLMDRRFVVQAMS